MDSSLPTSVGQVDSPLPSAVKMVLASPFAWYKEGTFDLGKNIWPDASGSNHATLSGSGFSLLRKKGHGAVGKVVALEGTTISKIDFGPVIKEKFTICSVTRWTGGPMGFILQGKGRNWYHGHLVGGRAGYAYYDTAMTSTDTLISPNTNWIVMCGANDRSKPVLANGVDISYAPYKADGYGDVNLQVNQGSFSQTSNFAIAEVVVWNRVLTYTEMYAASGYLMEKLNPPLPVSDCALGILFLCHCSLAGEPTNCLSSCCTNSYLVRLVRYFFPLLLGTKKEHLTLTETHGRTLAEAMMPPSLVLVCLNLTRRGTVLLTRWWHLKEPLPQRLTLDL